MVAHFPSRSKGAKSRILPLDDPRGVTARVRRSPLCRFSHLLSFRAETRNPVLEPECHHPWGKERPFMLLIKTRTGKSTVHGTGLFAAERIPKGTIIWRYDRARDMRMTRHELSLMPERIRVEWDRFAYVSRFTGLIVRAGDDYGYINHSHEPNIEVSPRFERPEGCDMALREILAGEELFFDYTWFGEDPCCHPRDHRLPVDIDEVCRPPHPAIARASRA
jgi:hypothetical protein